MKKSLKIMGLLLFVIASLVETEAQEPAKKSGVVKTAEKVNKKSADINAASNQVLNESQQVAGNIQQTVNNVKAVIKVFEPILRFRLRKKQVQAVDVPATNSVVITGDTLPATETVQTGVPEQRANADVQPAAIQPETPLTQADIANGIPVIPESPAYNTDGTANLGSQNNSQYGCYIDIKSGAVMDEVDAAGNARSVDVIFTATSAFNEQIPMYAFLTPAFVKNDPTGYQFFKGTKYKDRNIPPMSWETVNESEIAMTALTSAQFDKIKDNNQLMAVVRQVRGFSQKVESRVKLEGKVLAVKTEMGDRTAYGLICIVSHYGTTGDGGYLRIRIKVTGFDADGDGQPDAGLYQQ